MLRDPRQRAQVKAWWIVWVAMLPVMIGLQLFLPARPAAPVRQASDLFLQLAGVVPLFISIVVRWLALPRFTSLNTAFPLFLAGLALAECCGILGIVFGGPYRDPLFVLGLLGILQFMPVFVRQIAEPKPQGYIPNN